MDPVTLALQCFLQSMKVFEIVIQDIPKENRQQAWKDWYDFWHNTYEGIKALGK